MQIKKIGLFSAHSFAKPGGVQNHVLALYREFQKRGIDARIIAPGHSHALPYGIPKSDVITIGVSTYISANQSKAEFSVSIRKRFRQKILAEKFDILHIHNLGHGPLSYQILRHSQSLNILTVHFTADGSIAAKIPGLKQVIHKIYEKKFHGVIAVSPAALSALNLLVGFQNGPQDVIPNGIDLSRFCRDMENRESRKGYGITDFPHLLFVGRLEKRKGLLHLLRAIKILNRKNLRLTIIGEGEERKPAQDFTSKNNLSSFVKFAGCVQDKILPSFYASADIFCAPSLRAESFGMTLLEAMACGTPVVGFANPGYSYVMQGHEKIVGTSLLVPPGDHLALAEKIALLVDNKKIYESARAWGLSRVQKFAWPKIADKVINFYEEAQNARKTRLSV